MTIRAVQFAGALADPEVYGNPGNASASGGVISLPNDGNMTIFTHFITPLLVVRCFLLKQWSREEVTADGTGDVRQVMRFRVNTFDTGTFHLETIHDDAAHTFKFRLYGDEDPVLQGGDFDVTGTQTFSYGHANKRDILVVLDIDADEWSFYYNSGSGWVQDINGSDDRGPQGSTNPWIIEAGGTNSDSGTETEFAGGAYLAVDDFANFPDAGSDVTFQKAVLNGQSATHTDYDKGTGTNPDHTDVNDWESGTHDSGTSTDHMTSAVGVTKLQAYTTATLSPVAGTDVVSLTVFAEHAANSGGKFATGNVFIYDGTDITHSTLFTPSTSYSLIQKGFVKAPDGTTDWVDFSWANLEIGHRTITDVSEDTEFINLTAIYAEIIEIDEPASAAGSTIKPISIVHM